MSGRHRSLGNIRDVRSDSSGSGTNRKMTTAGIAEEAALLGNASGDILDDIELRNIRARGPPKRAMSKDFSRAQEDVLETERGNLVIAVEGLRTKPAIITYHDIGLNYISNFQAFFNFLDMQTLLQHFCVYHINAPGQEEGASTLPDDYVFPTMDELAAQVDNVMAHYGLKQFIGFGVGAGANILVRYAFKNPDKVIGLCLINCLATHAGWLEWSYQKMNARHLRRSKEMPQSVIDYLIWYHFGKNTDHQYQDAVNMYKDYLEKNVNATNLALFLDSYVKRTAINLQRDSDSSKKKESTTLQIPVINVTGAHSPHVDDTVDFNSRLNPAKSTWMKISDCGMVLEQRPDKLCEAFRLFLQGEGYVVPLSPTTQLTYQKSMLNQVCDYELSNNEEVWPVNINITENPISAIIY